ncbi:protein of unknown function DUF1128 [Caldalkalibacillus thermarum TA2.A1]|uniref:DUF1128 domain-containing protein n=1 Tax=Caldalkalibacillus thermarum (strain TA2.A1) TaxID=986075 RepID=F5LAF3_CALTT|nr:protein of unknown function DUF1128 [Caldalkalibacillus thermarum TA2.A1]QZT33290.1 DUF1128 domain-containing protein [Caldalkalibacillus thermarum TA2.A1]
MFKVTEKQREALEKPSRENIEYIIEWIKKKVNVVNTAAINPKSFDTDHYEDLLDLYDIMRKKDQFTMSELDSILTELGKMRKR